MRKGVVVLLLVVCLAFLFGCSGGGIVTVAKDFLRAIHKGNLERAKSYLALDSEFRTPKEKDKILERLKGDITNLKGKMARIEIKRTCFVPAKEADNPWYSGCPDFLFPPVYRSRTGEPYSSARVAFEVANKGMTDSIDLIMINGKWKVAWWNIFYVHRIEW